MARKSSASRRAAAKPAPGHRTKRKPAAKHKAAKFVYYFGEGKADGNGKMKGLLGGKGANLAEMTRIGLPVPPGFTISTEVCTYFYAHHRSYPAAMRSQVEEGIRRMERIMGTRFDAGNDGYHSQSRPERRDGGGGGEGDKQRAFGVGLLSALYSNVW